METSSPTLEKVINLFGYSTDGTSRCFIRIIQGIQLIAQMLHVIQSSLFVMQHDSIDSSSAQAFFAAIVTFQGFTKTLTFYVTQKELFEIRVQMNILHDKINLKNQQMFSKELKKYRLIVTLMFLHCIGFCIIFYLTVPIVMAGFSLMRGEEIAKSFLFNHWFPFDPYEYYLSVRVYNFTLTLLVYNCIVGLEGYLMLTFMQISVLFKSLAEDIMKLSTSLTKNTANC